MKKATMKSKILAFTLTAALLAMPVMGCTKKQEEPKRSYSIKTPDWRVKGEEKKDGDVKVEGHHKNGYGIIFEGKKDGSYDIKVKLPGDKNGNI